MGGPGRGVQMASSPVATFVHSARPGVGQVDYHNGLEEDFSDEEYDYERDSHGHEEEPVWEHRHDHHGREHGHTHEQLESPGKYDQRDEPKTRDFSERAYTIGIGGPVGSGKTALTLALCKALRDKYSVCVVTNDIFTQEDAEFLLRHHALIEPDRIQAVETGGCPHAAVREDITANLVAAEELTAMYSPVDLLFIESGGDNLAANFSRELADFIIYVIDVAGGDKVPRKGGPGVTQSDLLVVNKTDLADAVGASLDVMKRDARKMRGEDGPTVFAQCKNNVGVDEIIEHILKDRARAQELSLFDACQNGGSYP